MTRFGHWNRVYTRSGPTGVSWYQPRSALSLKLIERAGLPRSAAILDVGAGPSTLARDLLDRGFRDVTLLDCSSVAIEAARSGLGRRSAQVRFLEGDVTAVRLPPARFDLWHDRALFHFLTEAADREAYRAALARALRPGGHLIVATFALTGPERCAGLPAVGYDCRALLREFEPSFRLIASEEETHRTPSGKSQDYCYGLFRKRGP